MKKIKSYKRIGCLLLLSCFMQACSAGISSEVSCNFIINKSTLQRVSWAYSPKKITLYIHSSVPNDERYRGAIRRAVNVWNNKFLKEFGRSIFELSVTNKPVKGQDGISTIAWLKNWDKNNSNHNGTTITYYSGKKINEADISINAKHFDSNYSPGALGIDGYDLQALVIHELGHVLGLDDLQKPAKLTIMNAHLSKGIDENRREISEMDIESLKCEYEEK